MFLCKTWDTVYSIRTRSWTQDIHEKESPYKRRSRYPNGHLVKVLGEVGDKKTENEVLLLEHDVKHDPFSPAVLACLPDKNWTISPEELSKREDLRDYDIASVDPPGCTDIDDALHSKKLPNGNYEVRGL